MSEFTAEHFIQKFEAIPESQWTTTVLEDDSGCHCALWFVGVRMSDGESPDWIRTEESNALDALLWSLGGFRSHDKPDEATWLINDGIHDRYQQETPKARILAALEDVKGKESKRPLTVEEAVEQIQKQYPEGIIP